ncbi:protein-disulfide reductase DsbD domain-containing protein [Roseixanthobacter glucoisosaccharinicivorans]|uniref:protein-disulfide reductase DsbD domain-containing protein n=1 Tax=Roseixanthobacter glucoisosaccharinicivorans TaxID=3119923 RepID=UPI00372BD89A
MNFPRPRSPVLAPALLLALLAPAAPLAAAETPWSRAQNADVRLISGAVADGVLEAGIEIRLTPGWKTYWRYPGDSGVPPRFDWSGSRNVAGVDVAFPAPKRFSDGASGFSIGYKGGSVLLPLKVRLAEPGRAARLDLSLDFAVCEALCVPVHAQASLDIPTGGEAPNSALAAARAQVPAPAVLGAGPAPALLSAEVIEQEALPADVKPGEARSPAPLLVVTATVSSDKADLFVEGPDDSWALPLPSRAFGPNGEARFTLELDGLPSGESWEGKKVRLTLVDSGKSVEALVPLKRK